MPTSIKYPNVLSLIVMLLGVPLIFAYFGRTEVLIWVAAHIAQFMIRAMAAPETKGESDAD